MKIRKNLCCLDRKEIIDKIEAITDIVSTPRFICRKCARVSNKKKYLCKPMRLAS